MKVMLRAWLLYVSEGKTARKHQSQLTGINVLLLLQAIAIPLENILSYSIGWFIPFYASFRTLAVLIFVFYHKTVRSASYRLTRYKPSETDVLYLGRRYSIHQLSSTFPQAA
jgi:hypothetical protein